MKQNNYLGDQPSEHVDQYPTIMNLLEVETPDFVQGQLLDIRK